MKDVQTDVAVNKVNAASCWRLHRPTSVWTLLASVNSVIGLTAIYRIVRALRWDAVRGRGPSDLGRYRRSPRRPKWWRPYTSWGRFTSRSSVHVRHTQRQLANCFRGLCLRTSYLLPRRPHRPPPARRHGRTGGHRSLAPRSTPTALHWRLARTRAPGRCRRGGGLRVPRWASAARVTAPGISTRASGCRLRSASVRQG